MKDTPARRQFKKHFGQANHYLVTSLVAFYHLDAGSVVEAPTELHTSWNPKDKTSSVMRSRIFVLQSFLGSAVDSVDMYISLLYRKPNYIQDASLASILDGTNRSVLRKVIAVSDHYGVNGVTTALMDVLITWRNNLFHELAENKIRPESEKLLQENIEIIKEKYRGLDPSELPRKAMRGENLTFKETASLINAAHHFVQEVDAAVIAKIDMAALCQRVVCDSIENSNKSEGFAAKYFSLPMEKRIRFVRNWLANNYGMTDLSQEAIQSAANCQRRTESDVASLEDRK